MPPAHSRKYKYFDEYMPTGNASWLNSTAAKVIWVIAVIGSGLGQSHFDKISKIRISCEK